ncbi:RNA 2'-phosphotransferase [Aggregicoccus sp. 17bor-14]|uniref:RNA 2'-phosphotransferase n=1 Tax=Myxococcaceae TaxID=31 RepID=UPI00129C5004|nr:MULTISPECIES: RNA 2'-phosphotransferase [Myxococcaceae]MBF5041520.1 RNA 2'-phosphotransferase [Simulacricoccus sp. 17bor-14]MRI87305.1 RNA 2'-phosphotransferase [Aggregicoccus sp. 17bor-14]
MDPKDRTHVSKFLSLVLRHDPAALGVTLDAQGWTDVEALLAALHAQGRVLSREALEEIVATSPKQRFALSEDGRRIRANQGHSVEVDLGLAPAEPPETLFHGTVAAVLEAIRAQGLVRGQRHHVHLSADEATARSVGARRGSPVLLRVRAGEMHRDGHPFFRSENGVWLTDAVPPRYLDLP